MIGTLCWNDLPYLYLTLMLTVGPKPKPKPKLKPKPSLIVDSLLLWCTMFYVLAIPDWCMFLRVHGVYAMYWCFLLCQTDACSYGFTEHMQYVMFTLCQTDACSYGFTEHIRHAGVPTGSLPMLCTPTLGVWVSYVTYWVFLYSPFLCFHFQVSIGLPRRVAGKIIDCCQGTVHKASVYMYFVISYVFCY